MTAEKDMTHQFQVGDTGKTRDGREYRVIAEIDQVTYPLVVAVSSPRFGGEWAEAYTREGYFQGAPGNGADLLPPPPKTKKIVRWLVVRPMEYGDDYTAVCKTEEHAIEYAKDGNLMPDGKPLRIEIEVLDR